MKLILVKDTHNQIVSCYRCGARSLLKETYADLDGEPFRAYYCSDCAGTMPNVQIEENKS